MPALIHSLSHEFLSTWRLINRRSGFSALIVFCFAVGIGINALLFDTIQALFFRQPPGIERPEEVVRLVDHIPRRSSLYRLYEFDYLHYQELRPASRPFFSSLAGFTAPVEVRLDSARAVATIVSAEFFQTLGVRLFRGRGFDESDDRPDATATAIVSYELWQSRFGGDPALLGRELRIGEVATTVIGIAPQGFRGVDDRQVGLWLPLTIFGPIHVHRRMLTWHSSLGVFLIGRLRSDALRGAAEQALTDVTHGYQESQGWVPNKSTHLAPLLMARGPIPGREAQITLLLAGMAIIVLAVACTNAAMLLLVSTARRQTSIGVHIAVGATPGSLFRTSLFEAIILALLGCGLAFGLVVAVGPNVDAFLLVPTGAPVILPHLRLYWIAGATALVAGAAASVAPGLLALRFGPWQLLAWRGSQARQPVGRIGLGLLVLQVGLSTALLLATFAVSLSLSRLRQLDLGIMPQHLFAVEVPSGHGQGEGFKPGLALQEMGEALSTPSITGAALTFGTPLLDAPAIAFARRQGEEEANDPKIGIYGAVSPGYFHTIGTAIRLGRSFSSEDRPGVPAVIVISQNLADTLWPREPAVGHCLRLTGESLCREIVGVAANAPAQSVLDPPPLRVYAPLAQDDHGALPNHLLIRVDSSSAITAEGLRALLAQTTEVSFRITALQDLVVPQFRPWKLGSLVLGIYASVALGLALLGLYSVLSHWTLGRRREFGVRMALGATRAGTVAAVLRLGVLTSLGGVLLGWLGWWGLSRVMTPFLFHTSAFDPLLTVGALLVVMVVAITATLLPAWRAGGTNPAEVLRGE